ncbi:outer membrane beta-barrel protein [Aequorivita marina]|uniref:outer membrane beta-barrel protein n=1 Tax=Aequorivita marina TaxID=3073654 RepID=UPI002875EC59|nr:outer membrane beta-barrel protein [Aequorivita sp. S2608]MDS1297431.1 outer membrane beta-barrel protein [Aequorivita sp. S2608]
MKKKKNIDELFKEGFKNFEATPSPRVWENIQTELEGKKKERKVIPLWIRIGSVAALLALVLTVGNWLYNPEPTQNTLTNENTVQPENQTKSETEPIIPDSNASGVASENETIYKDATQDQESSGNTKTNNKGEVKSSSDKKIINSSKRAAAVASVSSDSSEEHKKAGENDKNVGQNSIAIKDKKLAASETIQKKKEEHNADGNAIIKEKKIFDAKKTDLAVEGKTENEAADEDLEKAETDAADNAKQKQSIFDAIAENNEEAPSKKINKKIIPEHRWKVAPNVAPVYYNSLGSGSSIDPSFTDNPQKGDVNMSYGVQVSYALNNRLSVRTGVNNVDLSYSTSDIIVGSGPVSSALRSVDYGGKQIVITAIDRATFESAATSTNDFGDITTKSTQGDARLIQNLNYYEVPLELKYAVIDSKFGLNVIGGVSTLFLGNNEVSVKADNFNSVLGEANNLSSVSFSTNVGLGLDYKLSKKFTFNIEPMFKYQLNPYTDSSVNFKPYYLGVYSGLSFKF